MYLLKSTRYIARATKYALGYFTLIKVYACMLTFSWRDVRVIIVNFVFMLIVASIQTMFTGIILDIEEDRRRV